MRVKFYDLQQQYRTIKKEIDNAIATVLEQASFYDSPFVEDFENGFAQMHQANHCIAVNSGTSALHATLLALDIGPGNEVLVPVNTFFATAEAVSLTGATPVFVDCEPDYFCIDTNLLDNKVSSRTRAIIAVHLYGQAANLTELKKFTEKHGLYLIEDCAHAPLATYKQQSIGTFGIASCFSFFPGKNLGAYGEGGAVLTLDSDLALALRKIRSHGALQKYYHERIGHNYRMEGIQGAILNVKLKYITAWTETRRQHAALYNELLKDCSSVLLPQVAFTNEHVYHLYVIHCQNRDDLKIYLEGQGIETGLHYPIPLHLQKAYASLNYAVGDFPIAEQMAKTMLSLPVSEQLTKEAVQYVAQHITAFYNLPVT